MPKAFLNFGIFVMIVTIFGLMYLALYWAKKQDAKPKPAPHYTIVIYDGCEYINNYTTHSCNVLTHKGNCTNTIHIYK